eukprot:12445611-Heterocapsa_arctica.AAC.1
MESVMRACDQPISADALQVVEVTPVPAILPDLLESLQSGLKVAPGTSPKPAKRKSANATSKKGVPRPSWADEEDSVEDGIDYVN